MLVSIVVPVYKVEKYLRQCLDSILAQTFRDMEIIVVDDGSPDACPKIIDEYAAKDARIVAVHQPNGGYGKAVNAGIARAKGKYVGIVESDDYIDPDMYASLVETAERTGADLTRCTFSIFDGKRDFLWDEVRELNARDGDIINPHEELDYFLYHSAPWCYLYRRELFETIRLSESKGASYQDVTLVGEALLLSKSVAVVGRPLLHYRMENGQGSSCTGGGRNLMAIVDRCEELVAFANDNGFTAASLRTMLVHKSIRAINWFYERINAEFRREFFDRMKNFFGVIAEGDIVWPALPYHDRLWLWTVLADRSGLSHPVMLQHGNPPSTVNAAQDAIMASMRDAKARLTARMFGALPPAFADSKEAILFAADRNYLPYLSVSIASVIAHADPKRYYDIVVFVDFDLTDAERCRFQQMAAGRGNVAIRAFDIRRHFTFGCFSRLFVNRHLTASTYYRFAAPYVLWDYDRVLWMDCDAVACEDVRNVLDFELGSDYVAGCVDLAVVSGIFPLFRSALAVLRELGYTHERDYICAGVMVFNLVAMRQDDIVPKLLETCAAHEFRMHDQDGINLVCQGRISHLDGKWNFIAHDNPYVYPKCFHAGIVRAAAESAGIWHFAGSRKPWHHSWRQYSFVWWRYARLSPYYEELLADMVIATTGNAGRFGIAQLRERAVTETRTGKNPGERRLKYWLPYGFMRWYVRRHYNIALEEQLLSKPGLLRRILFAGKCCLPYGPMLKLSLKE